MIEDMKTINSLLIVVHSQNMWNFCQGTQLWMIELLFVKVDTWVETTGSGLSWTFTVILWGMSITEGSQKCVE